jgi:hypothetical protein
VYFSADGDAAASDGPYLIFLALAVFGASLTSRSHHALDAPIHIKVPGYETASLSGNRLVPLRSVFFGSSDSEGRGPVPSVQPEP